MKKLTIIALSAVLVMCTGLKAQINGALDSTFGTNGTVHYDIGGFGYNQMVSDAKTGHDGKLYVAGTHGVTNNYQMFVSRFTAEGVLDSTFGNNGTALISPLISNVSFCYAMDIQADGKIVLAGYALTNDQENAIARLNTDGTLDTSFNHTGILTINDPNSSDSWYDVLVQADGKIVTVGVKDANGTADKAMLRLNPDGTFDDAFGNNGKVLFDEGGIETFYEIFQYAPNRYHVTGYNDGVRTLTQLNQSGAKILTFANSGVFSIGPFLGYTAIISKHYIEPNGKIWLAGDVRQGNLVNSFICRLLPSGVYDSTFSGDGIFTEDMSEDLEDGIRDFEVLPDGQVFIIGEYESPEDSFRVWTMIINQQGYVNTSYGHGGAIIYDSIGVLTASCILNRNADNMLWAACATVRDGHRDITLIRFKTDEEVGIASNAITKVLGSVNIYPNPFTGNVSLNLELNASETVSIQITDLSGRVVATLAQGETLPAGSYSFTFDSSLCSMGMYLVHLATDSERVTQQIVKMD